MAGSLKRLSRRWTTMKKYFGNLSLILILLALPAAAKTVRIYISNQDGSSIDVIDPATDKVIQTIKGMTSPDGVVFSPDGTRAYTPDRDEHVLIVLNTKTGETIKKIPLSDRPNLPVISMDGKRVFVAIWPLTPDAKTRGGIDIIDTATLQNVKTIPMKGGIHDMVATPDGKYLAAGSVPANFLSVIDLRTDEIAWELPFDRGVATLTVGTAPDGSTNKIFLVLNSRPDSYANGFAVVDFVKRAEEKRIEFPVGTVVSHEKNMGIRNSAHGIVVSPDGKTLWVCSIAYSTVFIYSLPDVKLIGRAPTGDGSKWISFTPDGKKVYVSNAAENTVSVIEVKTRKEIAQVPVGENPRHVSALVMP
jgi:YVTN family beta-propeller protein